MSTKFVLNIKIYLFEQKNVNLVNLILSKHSFLLSNYLFTVIKCLVGTIQINIHWKGYFFSVSI